MKIFPHHSEVLVSGLVPKEVLGRLEQVTKKVNFLDYERSRNANFKFNGEIYKNSFKISLVIDKADSFLPLITGKIETTPLGCILFLNYRLFPGSGFFLIFWSLMAFGVAAFFIFARSEYLFGLMSLLMGILNYLFAISHFKRKIKKSQAIFHKLLNPEEFG